LLYLALLLHDVGKAAQHDVGKHAQVGADLAMRAARRLQLEAGAADTVEFLVENHLILASTSQRRDLDDPVVIRQFARSVGTVERLNLLALLTFADAQGTSLGGGPLEPDPVAGLTPRGAAGRFARPGAEARYRRGRASRLRRHRAGPRG